MALLVRILLFVSVFMTCSCVSIHPSSVFYGTGEARQNHFVVVYVDKAFNTTQEGLIQKAFDSWRAATSNKLEFSIMFGAEEPEKLVNERPRRNAGIFIWYLPKYSQHIARDAQYDWRGFDGITIFGDGENSANIVIFDQAGQSESRFYSIALHESGHLIGLDHEPHKYAIMHPSAIADCISTLDAQQVCRLYDCVPKPECESYDSTF